MSIYVNAFATVRDSVRFASGYAGERSVQDDPSTAAALRDHLDGFRDYVRDTAGHNAGPATLRAVTAHIADTTREYAFTRPDGYGADDLREFAAWAQQTNAIFYLPDGSVRNAEGEDLLAATTPVGAVPVSAESLDRRNRIRSVLWTSGTEVSPDLPPVRGAAEITPRGAEEIFNRAVALAVLATIAAAVVNGKPAGVAKIRADALRTFQALEPAEAEFVDTVEAAEADVAEASEAPEAQEPQQVSYPESLREQAIQLHWSYIASETLAWMLGLKEVDMATPNLADVPVLRKTLRSVDRENKTVQLRPLAQLCDAAEHIQSLHWYAQHHGLPGYAPSVLVERHHALRWALTPTVGYLDISLNI